MNIEEAVGPVVTGLFCLALLIEKLAPREIQPRQRGWRVLGLVFFAMNAAINIGLPLLLPVTFIAAHSVLPGTQLGVAGGFVAGFLVWNFVYYWFHRLEHRVDLLWRLLHQLHHSPQRVDISGFAFGHPFDLVAATSLQVCITSGLLGLQPQASALVGLCSAIAALVQHTNMRTPRWVEWLLQRPEAHVRHHEYGQHAGNYADWPVWDKLFGTYRAPVIKPLRYGFDQDAARRIPAMLACVDVNIRTPVEHHE